MLHDVEFDGGESPNLCSAQIDMCQTGGTFESVLRKDADNSTGAVVAARRVTPRD